ncbi:hypothetical protein F2Q69_00007199 [Brassica cretica]|uniref:Uncharacterized protein n=1 Tax=Brassica cretica TaxID=69181 RepID=A0A8S9P9B5_BRACR|nr:hypothetical protein F2Q69_00007199 [Brassica cretica]
MLLTLPLIYFSQSFRGAPEEIEEKDDGGGPSFFPLRQRRQGKRNLVVMGLRRGGDGESGGREQSGGHGACGDATEKLVVVRRDGGHGACGEERRSWRGN